jgi:YHS domain-containing protein
MKKSVSLRLVILLAAALLLPVLKSAAAEGCATMGGEGCCAGGKMVAAADTAKSDAAAPKAKDAKANDYPLDTCPVTGEKLGKMGDPIVYNYKGREVRFCCKGCVKNFEKEPEKYLKKMDEAIIKKDKPAYPLTTCVVSGDKLGGSMGAPIDYVAKNNHLVRLCCKGCIKTFEKDPKPFLKKLDEARKAAEAKSKAGAKKDA